ncbi:unnamed protein product [Brachionus calyciflorus]|uniref:EF-hand domain-containing protein n=1 Tax=Brachionus calyciflorus TaxID=104777 RepID=A0A814IYR8_9BILA|nr:unnamed protein product [Brachionus calyciflorus]
MGNRNARKYIELKEKEIVLLMKKTSLSRQEILDWHAQFLKDYPDGLIDLNEFTTLYQKFYNYGNPERYAKFAFNAFDDDKSGKITFGEFLIATAFSINSSRDDDTQQSLEFAFDVYDVDDNGKVDKKEALTLITAVYELENGYSSADVQNTVDELFRYYDTDNTGYLNKKEFVTALLNDSYLRSALLVN